jgi:putative copper resistance protein D
LTLDVIAALVRALALAALFQAVGAALFAGYFRDRVGRAARPLRRLAGGAAVAAILLIAAHGCLETARLSGEFAGACDYGLGKIFWTSPTGVAHVVQMGGMAMIAACVTAGTRLARLGAAIGSIAATVAFAASGHTSIHPLRAILAPMLIIHVSVGACWFGSLGALLILMRLETTARTMSILKRFSQVAGYAVPILGLVGLVTALILVPRPADFAKPYGLLLISKMVLFVALLILASYNRWRYVPAMNGGTSTAAAALRRSIGWEIAIIMVVFGATATMTTYFSP